MYFNNYEEIELGELHLIPNLFVLYNKHDKTINYNGRSFNIYKKTKKAIENNFTMNKCKSFRHKETKLKDKDRFCYASIRLYDDDNPELIQFFSEQEHSFLSDSEYIIEGNESLKSIISVLNNEII